MELDARSADEVHLLILLTSKMDSRWRLNIGRLRAQHNQRANSARPSNCQELDRGEHHDYPVLGES